jgi:hypothetical protein
MTPPGTGRCRGDGGQVGGFEMLAFGLLVFLCGSIVVATLWAAVDCKLALSAATRDAARAYVEASDAGSAHASADAAARAALVGHGRNPAKLQELTIAPVEGDFGRCARVVATARYPLPAVTLPWIGGLGEGLTVRASHSELVDPYRSGIRGSSSCL